MIKIYGKNCINEAIRAHAKMEVYLLDTITKKDKNIIDRLNNNGYKYQILNKADMNSMFGRDNQGYGALREDYKMLNENDLESFKKDKGRILILDGLEDPHNLGAIIRSVDAFSYDLIILPKNRSVSVTEVSAHVSTGAIEWTPIMVVSSLLNTINKLKDMGYWILGTDASGDTKTENIDKNLSLAVIIGSEGFGMSKTLVKQCDYLITIPMTGHVNSLNASVSAGIVLKDLMRNEE